MRLMTAILAVFAFVIPTVAQSKYGLNCSGNACVAMDEKATYRMASAKSICGSGESGFTYPKKDVPSQAIQQVYWRDIYTAERIAEQEYRAVKDCATADLIVKIELNTLSDNVWLTVTDGDSGETVFAEYRSIHDSRSDLIRAAQHFQDAAKSAKLSVQEQQARAEEAQSEKERQANLAEKSHQCQIDFDSLRQMIILNMNRPVPQGVLDAITSHNRNCSNTINPEKVKAAKKADDDASLAKEEAAKDDALREKRMAEIEKVKIDALVAFKQQLVLTPFMPPTDGWMRAMPLVGSFYIILPGRKWQTNDCHFSLDGSAPALDCLGAGAGKSNYFSVETNNRRYLLKSKSIKTEEYAGTVKDGGTTICLRKAGCYHVLAEVRQVPTKLPDKFPVPMPGALTQTYSSDDFSFRYPENWKMVENKGKDNEVTAVQVAAPEAHLASWWTHGCFTGHVKKFSSSPETLDGAYEVFARSQRQRGLAINPDKVLRVGNFQARIATYRSSSVLDAGESGWIAVVKDKGEGFYWVMGFYPSNDDTNIYSQNFSQMLESFNFKK